MTIGITAWSGYADLYAVKRLRFDHVLIMATHKRLLRIALPIDASDGGDVIIAYSWVENLRVLKDTFIPLSTLFLSETILSYALCQVGLSQGGIVPVHIERPWRTVKYGGYT